MSEVIVLVDELDNIIGYAEKIYAHQNNLLHRAFSIFIFDWAEKRMLLQKRAHSKYHSGGLWTNACCSHLRKEESMEACLNNRIMAELGLQTNFHIVDPKDCNLLIDGIDVIYSCGKFSYHVDFDKVSENEIDHVFLYSPINERINKSSISINKDEVEEIKWLTIEEILDWIEKRPTEFTSWFKPAFDLAYQVLCEQIKNTDFLFR